VTVQSPSQAAGDLARMVDAALDGGNANALNAKVRAATAALARGQGATAVNQLGAFMNQVQALVQSGRLSAADGSVLTAAAQRIVASIESL
jgi:hypothetical protein